jgi:hypothetical protein
VIGGAHRGAQEACGCYLSIVNKWRVTLWGGLLYAGAARVRKVLKRLTLVCACVLAVLCDARGARQVTLPIMNTATRLLL